MRGLIIGKFMPLHNGHVALIEFAAAQCDELIVSMSFTHSDSIDPELRFSWIKEIFKGNSKIKPFRVEDTFDNESLPLPSRMLIWADFIKKTYPPIDVVFSSEEYGDSFALSLGVKSVVFDLHRSRIPVSATKIRQHPFRYWDFIPDVAKPYFVKKICFFGPESTGKSSVTIRMAHLYHTSFVPEVAREMLITNDFSVEDIIRIGHAHFERIQQNVQHANKFLMCDTDAITTQLYAQYYLGTVPQVLYELEKKVEYAHYFLFDIDVPWVEDGLRDLGHLRKEMFDLFEEALVSRKINYTVVKGDWDQRQKTIVGVLNSFL